MNQTGLFVLLSFLSSAFRPCDPFQVPFEVPTLILLATHKHMLSKTCALDGVGLSKSIFGFCLFGLLEISLEVLVSPLDASSGPPIFVWLLTFDTVLQPRVLEYSHLTIAYNLCFLRILSYEYGLSRVQQARLSLVKTIVLIDWRHTNILLRIPESALERLLLKLSIIIASR